MAHKHIMISYAWANKEVANMVHDLISSTYHAWKDDSEDGMGHKIYDSMGKAITNAEVVIAIVSDVYQQRPNCKLEWDGAMTAQKTILCLREKGCQTGSDKFFLGMAGSLYHEFSVENGIIQFNAKAFLDMLRSVVPVDSSARKNKKKHILLIGASNSGKSTIASMLINRKVVQGPNPNGISVTQETVSTTFNINAVENDEYFIIDTIGISTGLDSKGEMHNPFSTEAAVARLRDFLLKSRQGFHVIMFVYRLDRFSQHHVEVFRLFYEGMFPDMKDRFVIVATRTPGADMQAHRAEPIRKAFADIPIIGSNFQPIELTTNNPTEIKDNEDANAFLLTLFEARIANFFQDKPVIPQNSLVERRGWYLFIKKLLAYIGITIPEDEFQKMMERSGFDKKWLVSINNYM